MEDTYRSQWLESHQAHIRAVRQKLGLPTHSNAKMPIPGSKKRLVSFNSKASLIDQSLYGKELPKEVEKPSGPSAVESLRQSYAEILVIRHEPSSALSTPKQQLIDTVLARRSIERFDQKEASAETLRKLNEAKEKLKKDLANLQIQMEPLTDVSPRQTSNKTPLQSRVLSILARLPECESRVQRLREEFYKEAEAKLRPYLKSESPGSVPHPLQDVEMVTGLLNEVVEEVMDDYLRRVPEGLDPDTADQIHGQRIETLRKQISSDRALQLISEELLLETTLEMSKEVADEVFIVDKMSAALGFDLIFNSVQKTGKSGVTSQNAQDGRSDYEELTGVLLEKIKERDLHRKAVWKHTLADRPLFT